MESQTINQKEINQTIDQLLENSELEKALELIEKQEEGWLMNENEELKRKVKGCKWKVEKLREVVGLLEEQGGGWVCKKDTQALQTFYKQREDKKGYYMKIHGHLHIQPLPLFNMIFDHVQYPQWIPLCKSSALVKQIMLHQKIVHFNIKVPFLASREAIFHGFGVNRLNIDDTILIIAFTIDVDPQSLKSNQYQQEIKKFLNQKSVFMDIPQFCFKLNMKDYRTNNTSLFQSVKLPVSSIMNVDPKIQWLPQKVIDWFLITIIEQVFKLVIRKCQKFDFAENSTNKDNAEFNQWLMQILTDYINKK